MNSSMTLEEFKKLNDVQLQMALNNLSEMFVAYLRTIQTKDDIFRKGDYFKVHIKHASLHDIRLDELLDTGCLYEDHVYGMIQTDQYRDLETNSSCLVQLMLPEGYKRENDLFLVNMIKVNRDDIPYFNLDQFFLKNCY